MNIGERFSVHNMPSLSETAEQYPRRIEQLIRRPDFLLITGIDTEVIRAFERHGVLHPSVHPPGAAEGPGKSYKPEDIFRAVYANKLLTEDHMPYKYIAANVGKALHSDAIREGVIASFVWKTVIERATAQGVLFDGRFLPHST